MSGAFSDAEQARVVKVELLDKGRVVGAGAMPELTDDLVRNYLSV